MSHARTPALATAGLISVTAIWGSTFFLIKDLVERMPVADFLAVRFVIAALAMLLLFLKPLLQLGRRQWWQGLALGVVYGVGQLLQTAGLEHTSASVSGFVTGMYVVFTPLLGTVLLRQRLPPITWIAVLLALGGLALLALHGLSIGYGVWITLASALLYGLHIVGLGQWSRPGSAFALTTVQMIAVAVVCLLATLPHGPTWPPDRGAWIAVVYMALAAGAGAMLMQTWAQAHLSATRAAIVMTLEPVFAAAFAVSLGNDTLTWRMLVGGALVLAAMYLVELAPRRKVVAAQDPSAEALHHEL
ncbi:DMT family transporter [Dyella tabacisoli]|uniref:DMT family transporter n=1 Tax=Dyella tabacisoli TaxID=2282381 RepID=A0A369URG4_9GAMM|nr:DMT family transporter [Dyella tabacisoli]RDD82893.1 DMT family transporter [Dyella tabacisoli]